MARRFFYDCEFMEEPGFLDLISIGVIDESADSSFYAISLDANIDRANDWVKQNVLSKMPPVWDFGPHPGVQAFHRDELRDKLLEYLKPSKADPVELWGYYSAYDHVLLCWIFGRMIDLPEGMPMNTLDIKQEMVGLGLKRSALPPEPHAAHHALADAKWNRDAWIRIQTLKKRMEK